MFCCKCGSKIDDDAKFCRHCGEKMNTISAEDSTITIQEIKGAENQPAMKPKKKNATKGLIIGLAGAVVLIIALIVVLIVVLGRDQGTDVPSTPSREEVIDTTKPNDTIADTNEADNEEVVLPTESQEDSKAQEDEAPSPEPQEDSKAQEDETPSPEPQEDSDAQEDDVDEPAPNVMLLDQDGIYAEFRGIYEHSSQSWIVNLYIENNRDSEIYFSLRDGLINKFSMGFSNNGITVPANGKYLAGPNFDLIIDLDELAEYGVTEIETLEFVLHISTDMFGDTICDIPVSLNVNKKIPSEYIAPAAPQSSEILLDENDVYVEFRGISEYSSQSWIINLYVENNRSSEIYLYLGDGQINKFSIGFSNNGISIPANSKYLASPNFDLIIDLDDLAEYGITSIETLDFYLEIRTDWVGDTIAERPVALEINKDLP